MKKPIIVANWKMNLGPEETTVLLTDILGSLKKIKNKLTAFDLVFCPNVLALEKCSAMIGRQKTSPLGIFLGAQNCCWEDRGA
ncbi:MAG: triose-phosphate isomerase [Candidatus Parcubacteria bacterium]|nr:triose-phosphate isomerase [Candidatus Parcubacteria bacterium]